MPAKLKLTDALVKRLPTPARGNAITYDAEVAGLGARVTAAGARSFVLNYRTRSGRERRYTIGACGDWSATDARAEARRLRYLVDQGGDPLADLEAERSAPTVADLCDRFEAEVLPRRRPGTAVHYRGLLKNYIRPHFGMHRQLTAVTFADIDSLHRSVTAAAGPFAANRAVGLVARMFALATTRWGMCTTNPCRGIEKNAEPSRHRYLSGDELARLTGALAKYHDRQAADVIRILLLTGCRKGEALSMRFADVDLTTGTWSKPAASTKQKRDHVVPLSAPVRQLLAEIRGRQPDGEFVFPSARAAEHRVNLKGAWKAICKAAGIVGLRPHDLRHSFASQLASGGASLPLIGALLGHTNAATTSKYAHMFSDPQRAAVEKVGAIIAGNTIATVVPIKKGGAA
jgi:integrase